MLLATRLPDRGPERETTDKESVMRNDSGAGGARRRRHAGVAVLGIAVLGITGCQADRQTFEEGATLETPPQVEAAPAAPFPAQGVQRGQPGQPGVMDTLPADTLPRP
jgi:hypothetical protein